MAPSLEEDGDEPLLPFASSKSTIQIDQNHRRARSTTFSNYSRHLEVHSHTDKGLPFCCIPCHTNRCATHENRYKMAKFFVTVPMVFILGVALAFQAEDLIDGLSATAWKEQVAHNTTNIFPAVSLCLNMSTSMVSDASFGCKFWTGTDSLSPYGTNNKISTPSEPVIFDASRKCSFNSSIDGEGRFRKRCFHFNTVEPKAFGSRNGIMELTMNWSKLTSPTEHTMVNLYNPMDTEPSPMPSFYMKLGAEYYILLSQSIDTSIRGTKTTFFFPVPSDVTFDRNATTNNSLKFSYQNDYVNLRFEEHTYTWPLFLATMGGFLSACNFTRIGLLFVYKVFAFGCATRAKRRKQKKREMKHLAAHSPTKSNSTDKEQIEQEHIHDIIIDSDTDQEESEDKQHRDRERQNQRQRERDNERDRERETETERERQRQRQRERQRESVRERATESRQSESQRESERQTVTERERETERQTQKQGHTGIDRDKQQQPPPPPPPQQQQPQQQQQQHHHHSSTIVKLKKSERNNKSRKNQNLMEPQDLSDSSLA